MTWLVETFLAKFTYFALIALLTIASMGVPIPEDIPLVFSGYLCSAEFSPIALEEKNAPVHMIDTNGDGIPDTPDPNYHRKVRKVPDFYCMILAGMIGVLLGDSIVFSIGRRGIEANNFVARHLRKVMHSKRREKVERHFAKHGNLTVFAGRFLPGFRSIVFAFAGMSKMSYPRFLLIDGLAAAVSVPTFVWIGWKFANQFNVLFSVMDRLKWHVVLPACIVLVCGGAVLYMLRRRRAAGLPVDNI